MISGRTVEPVGRGRIVDPYAFRAHLIGDDIQHQLHAVAVNSGGEIFVILQCAEVRIDLVHVDRFVSVIVLRERVGRIERRDPESGDPELLQVVQMIFDDRANRRHDNRADCCDRHWQQISANCGLAVFPCEKRSGMMRYITSAGVNP